MIKTHSKTRLASSKERDPQRSSKKSISPLKFTPNKKSTYIEKFANKTKLENEKKKSKSPMKKSPHKTIKKETPKNEAKANQSLRYFHPSPNKYKRRTERESMDIHLGKPPMSREQFLSKMKEQCYVKRFLKEDELDTTYNELVNTRVDPYLWQQKVIEKIFKKIHETDNIIWTLMIIYFITLNCLVHRGGVVGIDIRMNDMIVYYYIVINRRMLMEDENKVGCFSQTWQSEGRFKHDWSQTFKDSHTFENRIKILEMER